MKGIILAAGRGSRLKSQTEEKPKGLIKLAGKALLEWQIDAFRKSGISDIIIITGYLSHLISFPNITCIENKRWEETNMLSSLLVADKFLKNDTCIISYADILYTPNTVKLIMERNEDISITYDKNWKSLWEARFSDPLSDAETFCTDEKGVLIEIGGKTNEIGKIKGQYMGLLKFTSSGWEQINNYLKDFPPEKVDKMDMTGTLSGLISSGVKIQTVPITDPWLEVDDEDDLNVYEKWMSDPENIFFKTFTPS